MRITLPLIGAPDDVSLRGDPLGGNLEWVGIIEIVRSRGMSIPHGAWTEKPVSMDLNAGTVEVEVIPYVTEEADHTEAVGQIVSAVRALSGGPDERRTDVVGLRTTLGRPTAYTASAAVRERYREIKEREAAASPAEELPGEGPR